MDERKLDGLCINTLRMLSVDMVEKANSGHPGMPLGAAPMAYVIFDRFLRFNPKNPFWPDRDRFVLSAGHGSALLYAVLHMSGYDLPMEELMAFRQWESMTPGHPERRPAQGVEVTTGPLGQGFANGVGLAIAERHLAAMFNRPGYNIVDHYTCSIVSDGDLMEGVASEAASIAGHLKLGRLIYLFDNNHVTLSASTRLTFTEDVGRRFEAYGWHVQEVADGNDVAALEGAVRAAKDVADRPSLIIVPTQIGYGSPREGSFEVHGSPLGPEGALATKRFFGWPESPPFYVPDEALAHFRKCADKGERLESSWMALFGSYKQKYPDLAEKWELFQERRLPDGWEASVPSYGPEHKPLATRSAGREIMNAIAASVENMIGGSADLDPSTRTALSGKGSFQPEGAGDESVQGSEKGPWSYAGANVSFGVREHAMASIVNGIAAHGGLIPYGSTFLIFSDYMRPAIRLAALSGIGPKFIFTHDSVALGEDGPTHQPVEHIPSLRAIPGVTVIRPCDANETAEAWKVMMEIKDAPVALLLTRQDMKVIDRAVYAPAVGLRRGAYVLADPPA